MCPETPDTTSRGTTPTAPRQTFGESDPANVGRDAASVHDELREAMAIVHRVKLRLAAISDPDGEDPWFPTEIRLLDEVSDRLGRVVRPKAVSRG